VENALILWERPLAALAAWVIIGILLRLAIWTLGPRLLSSHARPAWGQILSGVVRGWVIFWFTLAGLAVAHRLAPLTESQAAFADKALLALFLGSVTLAASTYATRLADHYGQEWGLQVSTTSLTLNLVRVAVVALGVLIILANLGVSITPLLTALGVGSLAVALALQDTLSNFFAGLHVILSKQIRVGDYIRLDSGAEGQVDDIAWRSCRLRSLDGNLILVPNAKLAQAIVTNTSRPQRDLSVTIECVAAQDSDLEKVEHAALEVAAEVMAQVKGGAAGFTPGVSFHGYDGSRVQFSVSLRASEFAAQYPLRHEFIKRLLRKFEEEGIRLPSPNLVMKL
jgi:small-conductance mechanosensitive channel